MSTRVLEYYTVLHSLLELGCKSINGRALSSVLPNHQSTNHELTTNRYSKYRRCIPRYSITTKNSD